MTVQSPPHTPGCRAGMLCLPTCGCWCHMELAAVSTPPRLWACHDCPWMGTADEVIRFPAVGSGPEYRPTTRSLCPACGGWPYEIGKPGTGPRPRAVPPGRCLVTGNPCGTDTRPVGRPSHCANCEAAGL